MIVAAVYAPFLQRGAVFAKEGQQFLRGENDPYVHSIRKTN
jgi:hypothetical protein